VVVFSHGRRTPPFDDFSKNNAICRLLHCGEIAA
jgi:hypothetical protein